MNNLFDLTGKVALVTGASSGLGVQMAKALAGAGADVAIVARREEKLMEVKKEIEALGVRCYVHKCDVSDVEQIKQTVKDTEAYFGKIDILCNNAGLGLFDKAENQSDEIWTTMMKVNLFAPYYFSREVAKGMIARGYGKIIMTGSIHSTVGMMELPLSAYMPHHQRRAGNDDQTAGRGMGQIRHHRQRHRPGLLPLGNDRQRHRRRRLFESDRGPLPHGAPRP